MLYFSVVELQVQVSHNKILPFVLNWGSVGSYFRVEKHLKFKTCVLRHLGTNLFSLLWSFVPNVQTKQNSASCLVLFSVDLAYSRFMLLDVQSGSRSDQQSKCINVLNTDRYLGTSVTSKKSPNVYQSCPKMISLEQWKILTNLQKLPKMWAIWAK